MTEYFLAWLWKFRHLDSGLILESGEQLLILSPGTQNTDGGPDFFNARIRIDDTTWAGNVELHVKSSDWYRHDHHKDDAYRNAILHVVYENDTPVTYPDGHEIPTLVVKHHFPPRLFDRFIQLGTSNQWIPCYNQLKDQKISGFSLWSPALATEKFINKSQTIRLLWESALFNWDEAFYRQIAWCFGFRVNNIAFELLAKSISLKIIQQNASSLPLLEALLFGQAGMLEDEFEEDYPQSLKRDYNFLRAKYRLAPCPVIPWKFLRMRPSNFPTIRISQWANLLHITGGKFFQLLEHGDVPDIFRESKIVTSEYWFTHYLFDKPSVFSRKTLGRESADLIMINGIAPFLFFYGFEKAQPAFREKALELLERLGPENNAVITRWKSTGLTCENALHSQALLYLKKDYCDQKRCLECRIGHELLAETY
jgi:hypothetical protein